MSVGVNETHDVSPCDRAGLPSSSTAIHPQTGQSRNTTPTSEASVWRNGHLQRPGSSWGAQMLFGTEEK